MAYATQTQSLSGNVFAAVSAFFAELSEAAERRRVYKTTYAELTSLSARLRHQPATGSSENIQPVRQSLQRILDGQGIEDR